MNIAEWAQYVAMAISGAFGLLCVFDGTRRMVGAGAGGGRRAAIGMMIVGVIVAYFFGQHWVQLDVLRAYRGVEAPRELPPDWGKKMSPAKREAASQNSARGAFVSSGALRQHFDISGQRKLFAPAPDDLKRREEVLATAARVEHRADESFQAAILWLVLGLSAFVFGVAFALEPEPEPKPAEEPDTRVEPTLPSAAAPAKPAGAVSGPVLGKPAVPGPMPAKPPLAPNPAAPAKSAVGEDTLPLPGAPAKPAVGESTVPLPPPPVAPAKSTVGERTVPLPPPPVAPAKPKVGEDTVPLAKAPPGTFTPPKKS